MAGRKKPMASDAPPQARSPERAPLLPQPEINYSRVLENIGDVVVIIDANGINRFKSPNLEKLFGWRPEEVVGRPALDLVHPDDVPQAISFVGSLLQAPGARKTTQCRYRCKDGLYKWIEFTGINLLDDPGIGGILGNYRDITALKQVEEALVNEQQSLKAILDTTGTPIFVKDNEHRIILANPASCEMFGMDVSAVIGKTLAENIPENELKQFFEVDRQVLDTGKPDEREESLTANDIPTRHYVTLKRRYIDQAGRKFVVASCHDITERMIVEQRQALLVAVLRILNEPGTLQEAINKILAAIQRELGVDAVGIRLRQGDDFPYFFHRGFDGDFLIKENSLAEHRENGDVCRNPDGTIRLECTCGLVLSGKTPPNHPLFTPHGSFWSNDTRPILDLPPDQDPRLHPRNHCIHAGFNSVALVPIRIGQEIVGLLQLNDHRTGCFALDTIRFFEGLSDSISIALFRKQMEKQLRKSEYFFRESQQAASIGSYEADFVGGVWKSSDVLDQIFGIGPNAVRSIRGWQEIVHPDDRTMMEQYLSETMLARTATFNKEYRIIRKSDHAVRWVLGLGTLEFHGDKAVSMIGTIQDITERKQMEVEALRLRNELFHMDRVARMGEMASALAHELNQPLGGILLNAETAHQMLAKDAPDLSELRTIQAEIAEDAARAGDVIRRLRAFLRRDTSARKTSRGCSTPTTRPRLTGSAWGYESAAPS